MALPEYSHQDENREKELRQTVYTINGSLSLLLYPDESTDVECAKKLLEESLNKLNEMKSLHLFFEQLRNLSLEHVYTIFQLHSNKG